MSELCTGRAAAGKTEKEAGWGGPEAHARHESNLRTFVQRNLLFVHPFIVAAGSTQCTG